MYFHVRRAGTYTELKRWGSAQDAFEQARILAEAHGDRALHAWTLNDIGLLAIRQERYEDALDMLSEALSLSRDLNSARLEAVIHGNLGEACMALGRHEPALDHCRRGLRLRRLAGDRHGEAWAVYNVACAWARLGDHEQAMAICREAIALGRTVGNIAESVAPALDTLASCLHHVGRTAEALDSWREAAELFDRYGRPDDAERVRARCRAAEDAGKAVDDGDHQDRADDEV
ncbi:tetratricopeptide repeat protein [Actinophytocola algeriensis]|uniref:Tetratricopeptide (TPR) repeat protein n=1 Tax=Actinophytocola algeriensis TaxID=1768010 RepID=A0A7W7Q387_9PSEU|nr:tetratricopeptide repeat protein [Actinophytocola algeriensis]MBB4906018.1 tetratricopeptide (TPR) repeat protein [Actinophytocola algeriensis]MBE1472297.1 tetratricopeptide (TPR) repeat protein [Actinophytocola algeriensis]